MSGFNNGGVAPQDVGQDLTRVVLALQELIKASYLTQQTLLNGISVNTGLPVTTVAGLPVSAPVGQMRYASNGRNSGQGAGTGTGTTVIGNGTVWTAIWSGLAVTV
jgi:hypothetical protein